MIIGIDASRAFVAQATGTEIYSRNLMRALVAKETDARFRFYTRGEQPDEFSARPRIEVRPLKFPRLWTHLRLSAEMVGDPPDCLFVPAHVIPLIHPRASFVTVHDLGYLYFPDAHRALDRCYLDLSTRWNVRAARKVFADSNATKHDLQKFYHVPSSKIVVAYPGIDNQQSVVSSRHSDTLARYGLANDYVLAVGTLQPRKNYLRLIEAFAKMDNDLRLIIVGRKGWLYDSIFKRVVELGLQARVKFLDYVPREDLSALYMQARLFVFPSLYEGFGLPVLEAMACGTPVVCSNSSSLPEVGGSAAVYFDPHAVNAIREAMEDVLNNETLRNELRAKGFENVKRFTWEECAEIVLKELVNG